MKTWTRKTWLLGLALLAIACSSNTFPQAPYEPPLPTLANAPATAGSPYLLSAGDQLAVKFYKNPELNEEVVVRPDGMISLQLIEDIQAAGRTPAELSAELKRLYAKELAEPAISVIVRKPARDRVYVGGEVGKQGFIRLTGGLTVFQAIQESGGFTKSAHRKQVILIRRTPDGKAIGRSIDVRPVQSGEAPQEDVLVAANDVIFVPRSKIGNVDNFVQMYVRDALPFTYLPIPTF